MIEKKPASGIYAPTSKDAGQTMSDMILFLTISAVAMAVVVGFAVGAILVEKSWRKRMEKYWEASHKMGFDIEEERF